MLCRGRSETHHAVVRRYGVIGVTDAQLHKRPQTAYLRQKQKLRALFSLLVRHAGWAR